MSSIAVVTGGGGAIGRAICQHLAVAGRTVVVIDRDSRAADATVRGITSDGGHAVAKVADVRDSEAMLSAASRVRADLGSPSVLVNCAGWDRPMRFADSGRELWQEIIDINYLGVLIATRSFLDDLIVAPRPRAIVNISSDAGRVGSSNEAVYSGAKAAVIGFSKALARELARSETTVNCVAPGPTDSPMLDNLQDGVRDAMVRQIPLRRIATPADIAAAVMFFVSPAADYVTGQVLSVSGGLTMAS